MMKLRTMQAVDATLDEKYRSPIADCILAAWEHDPGSARYLRASANFIFVFKRADQPLILRFAHEQERSVEAIQAEVRYLQYLSAHGAHVTTPMPSLSGQLVESVATALGTFHAVVFPFVEGTQFETDQLSLEQFTRWGAALAQFHQIAQTYTESGRLRIDDQLAMIAQQLPAHEHAARTMLSIIQHDLATVPRTQHNFGLIHYDFELDNLIWNDQRIDIVDFDDCVWHWFVADIAFALRDLFHDQPEQIDLDNEAVGAFIAGYRGICSLDDEELAALPLFLRTHNLMSFTKLVRALDDDEPADAPMWVAQLRTRLLTKIQGYRDTFSAYAV